MESERFKTKTEIVQQIMDIYDLNREVFEALGRTAGIDESRNYCKPIPSLLQQSSTNIDRLGNAKSVTNVE